MSHCVEKVLPAPKRTIEWTRTNELLFGEFFIVLIICYICCFCKLCFCPSHFFAYSVLLHFAGLIRLNKGNAIDKALLPLHTTTIFTCSLKTKSRYKEHSTKSYLKPWPESLQCIHISMSCSIWLMHLNT